MSIDELIESSDQIVIASVTHVEESTTGAVTKRVAYATVNQTLKGQDVRQLQFDASTGSFACSTVDAQVGETALLFLL